MVRIKKLETPIYLKISILLLIFLFSVDLILAETIRAWTEEGNTVTLTLEGNEYDVTCVRITGRGMDVKADLIINNKPLNSVMPKETYKVDEKIQIYIWDIGLGGGDVPDVRYVEFNLTTEFCGNNNCDVSENCSSCNDDCFCDEGYRCLSGQCIANIICGDSICLPGENCPEDECCGGAKVDFDDDKDNCGRCGKRCEEPQICDNGRCVQECGNNRCESKENCDSCPEDCICQEDERCERRRCRTYCGNGVCESDESYISCSTDCEKPVEDIQIKEEPKKECESGCTSGEGCVPKGTHGLRNNQQVYCNGNDWIPKKELNENCEFNYECKINSCINGICKESTTTQVPYTPPPETEHKNIITRFFNWLKGLFKL